MAIAELIGEAEFTKEFCMALTDKQRRFVDEYLVDLSVTQAAIRAGCGQKAVGQIGEQNLKKLEIGASVQEARAARSKRTEVTQDMVLRELAKIGFSDIRKIVRWGKRELRVSDASEDEGEVTEPYHGRIIFLDGGKSARW